jgi:ketosteroid isomerase-like protein
MDQEEQQKQEGAPPVNTQREADEDQIKQQVARIAEGIRARDLESLRPIYADDVVSFDVEAPLQHVGIEAKLKNWATVFTIFREADYEVRDLAVAVGGDVAFGHCFGRLHGTLADGTATEGMWVRATFCFQRLDGAWRIVHDQASVPFDLRSGRGVVDLEP